MRRAKKIFLILAFCFSFSSESKQEYSDIYSQSTYGGIGLIQTPSARFSEDGEFLFGISSESPYNRLFAKVQFFPWMEAVLRYTEGKYQAYNPGSHQTWKDKGIDLKFKLLDESKYFPSIAMGLIDVGGTGVFSGEYIVTSKRYNNFDISLGLGWGRLGGLNHINNIFGWFDDGRRKRGGTDDLGGKIIFDRFFSGEKTSFFGGIEYFSNIPNLSYKLEYDSSDYSSLIGKEKVFDASGDIFKVDSRLNYALNYKLNLGERDKVDFSLGFVRGNTIYANLAVHSNLNFSGTPRITIGGEKIRNSNLPGGDSFVQLDQRWQKFLINRTIREMANSGFVTHNIIYDGDEVSVEISQSKFQKSYQAIDLASKILANNAPKNIKTITVINIDQGIETLRASISRQDIVKFARRGELPEEVVVFNNNMRSDGAIVRANEYLYPNFFWSVRPNMLGTLQHQEKFYFWQLEALFHSTYSIKKGLYLTTDIGINIDNNYKDYTYHIPDGELYHVRQNRRLYLTEGETGLRRMALDYLVDLAPNIKGKFSVGYLEWMYGGIGGEILYIPDNKRWAIGIDTYWVKQREFNQRFSFKDYETVTGFVSYYRDIPIYDMRLKMSMGKFLAKDIGAQIDLSRRFKTGARIGGIVSLTDCDSQCVGEGSFNKWVYFELPMDLFYTQSSTRNKTGYAWSPLTKDAGQKIHTGGLYEIVTDASDEIDSLSQKSWSIKKIFGGFSTQPSKRI